MRKVNITGAGAPRNTQVRDAETLEIIPGVVGIQLTIERDKPLTCDLSIRKPGPGHHYVHERVEVSSLSLYK